MREKKRNFLKERRLINASLILFSKYFKTRFRIPQIYSFPEWEKKKRNFVKEKHLEIQKIQNPSLSNIFISTRKEKKKLS